MSVSKAIEPYKGLAEIYEETRPSYPEALINDVIHKAELKQDDLLLEIGPGTGKATVLFAEKGFSIKAVEIGEDMAAILRDKCAGYKNVSVDVCPFEEWISPGGQKYNMIFSAQTFHWIDKDIKYKKCHNLLKDSGHLVLFWYSPSSHGSDKLSGTQEKIDMIVGKYTAGRSCDTGKPKRREHYGVYTEKERETEIVSSGLFRLVEKLEYTYEIKENADKWIKAMKSAPDFASKLDGMDDDAIEKMDNEIKEVLYSQGGSMGTMFRYTLYIAEKIQCNTDVTHDK